jgi:glycosyltransferase involved in cell wall biosynthesis
MQKPFFSIIIPTLNEEIYLPRLLNDLFEQRFHNFEVIVVDGGSKDDTCKIVKKLSQQNDAVGLIKSLSGNVGQDRNLGADEACGNYLVFVDADTQIKPNFLDLLHQQLLKDRTDYGTVAMIGDSSSIIDRISMDFTNILLLFFLKLNKPFMGAMCLFIKKNVFTSLGGFDKTVVHAEDHELVQRAAINKYRGVFYFNPKQIICLRRLHREGRIKMYGKYIYSFLYILFIGPIRKPIFDYRMGGDVK